MRDLVFVWIVSSLVADVCLARQLPYQQRAIEAGPVNVAAFAGDTIIMNCSVSSGNSQQWFEYATNPTGALVSSGASLQPGHQNFARYELDVFTGTSDEYNLHVTNTIVEDGGRYECQDDTAGSTYSAEFVVIEAPANCTTALPADGIVLVGVYYTVECTVWFGASDGIWPSTMWSGPGEFTEGSQQYDDHVFTAISFTVAEEIGGGRFNMHTYFTQAGFGGTDAASNIPTWFDDYYTQTITVHYGPYDVYYSPVMESYEIGAVITCHSKANPTPSYVWKNMDSLEEFYSQSITVTADMAPQTLIRCQVINSVSTANIFANISVTAVTGTTTMPPPPTTTPQVENCLDLSGRWEYDRSPTSQAVLCLTIDADQNGYLTGLLWNDTETDTHYMEIMGRTRLGVYDDTGFTGIWALDIGVSAFAAECHQCDGVERMLVNLVSRSSKDNAFCGDGGTVLHSPIYYFHRVPPSYPCSSPQQMSEFSRQAKAKYRSLMA